MVALDGDSSWTTVTLADRKTGSREAVPCQGLFCFIGAVPSSEWLDGVALDEDGFVLTDHDIPDEEPTEPSPCWDARRCRSKPVFRASSRPATSVTVR